jgi:Zn-finger nucleic acid-binding protein
MGEVSARANPGQLIVLDQCPRCGGIWCDRWELFPIAPEEGPRLDSLDEDLLRSVAPMNRGTLYCPRCRDRLQPFKEPLLPSEIQLQRCRRCDGIWLNRGTFGRFKQWQQRTRKEKMPAEERVRGVVEKYSDPKSWVTTGTRGIFAYPRGEDEGGDLPEAAVKGALKLILQALLRLVWPL